MSDFSSDNPRIKPYLCAHSVDAECFKKMESLAKPAKQLTKCPQCRAPKRFIGGIMDLIQPFGI